MTGSKMIGLPGAEGRGIYFRKKFHLDNLPKRAVLRISALGIYKGYINGKELDEQVFLQGRTSYSYRGAVG